MDTVDLKTSDLRSCYLGALILFYIDLSRAQWLNKTSGIKTIIYGIVVTYAIALVGSGAILWFYGRFDSMPPIICIVETVVLGLPATLGTASGRLLMQ